MLGRITDEPCQCTNCGWSGTVYDCEGDVDEDGSLGCPECGQVTSVAYGPSKNGAIYHSVNVLTGDGQTFERPYMAHSYEHATEIALAECIKRGWVNAL